MVRLEKSSAMTVAGVVAAPCAAIPAQSSTEAAKRTLRHTQAKAFFQSALIADVGCMPRALLRWRNSHITKLTEHLRFALAKLNPLEALENLELSQRQSNRAQDLQPGYG